LAAAAHRRTGAPAHRRTGDGNRADEANDAFGADAYLAPGSKRSSLLTPLAHHHYAMTIPHSGQSRTTSHQESPHEL
jgi:hypothetical protein